MFLDPTPISCLPCRSPTLGKRMTKLSLRCQKLIYWQAVSTNNKVIETSESYGVRSYIFIPCIVYGEGNGFGNRISIQTVAIVKAAKHLRSVYDVNSKGAVCTHFPARNMALLTVSSRRGLFVTLATIQPCMSSFWKVSCRDRAQIMERMAITWRHLGVWLGMISTLPWRRRLCNKK
jgi:hypothetical protein